MKTIIVHLTNGSQFTSNVTGTENEILSYFVGHKFAIGDLVSTATSVEFC